MVPGIDSSSPLYLHPSDGSNSISVEKLEGASNYRSWKRTFEIGLASKRKLGFVTGTVKRDGTDAVKQEAWDTCNSMVISWILGSVSDSIKRSVMFLSTSCMIWTQLEQRFSVANGSRKYKLNKDLYEKTQEGKSITDYYTEMKVLWEELENLRELPPITTVNSEITAFISAINEQQEELKLFQFLNGLDDAYAVQRSHLLMMNPLPSLHTACSYLHQEESQREVLKPVKEEMETAAMMSKGTEVSCTECGKYGHSREKCWRIVGYPAKHPKAQRDKPRDFGSYSRGGRWNRGGRNSRGGRTAANVRSNAESSSNAGSGATITAHQLEQLMRLLPTPSKTGTSDTEDEMDLTYAGMVSCNFAGTEEKEWIIDSGASDHMTGCLEAMMNVVKCTREQRINLPTGATSKITHCGDVQLRNGIVLKNVLYIPSFKHNLLSVQKLSKDQEMKVEFHSDFCVLHMKKNGQISGVGKVLHGLYYLVNLPLKKIMSEWNKKLESEKKERREQDQGPAAMSANVELKLPSTLRNVPSVKPTMLWHWRLGHAPMNRISKIEGLKGFKEECGDVCITCPVAKFTKLPFGTSESRAEKVFDLIHIDIWGPYRVSTRMNHRYFLTLVDDHSRVTWVHLLKHKSDAFTAIQNFVNMSRTQFGEQVKAIRSDNALEFGDSKCKPFFNELGILHQTSCVDRPEQNGRAERKHRNILEMARALRFESGLPLQYWGDCVMCAVHITNRLPSTVLKGKTPYEVLYKSTPLYNHLKVFGCLVLASNPSRKKDKFHARGVPCVFLGYPQSHKGYKLLNLTNNSIFVSRDVRFYENIFPYKIFHSASSEIKETELNVNPISTDENLSEEENEVEIEEVNAPRIEPRNEGGNLRRSSRAHKTPSWHQDYVTEPPKTTSQNTPFSNIATQITPEPVPLKNSIHTETSPLFSCFLSQSMSNIEPRSYKEAVKDPKWVKAMNEELSALEENGTWSITKLPHDKQAIACKWLYKIKYNCDGSINRYKSRLVIMGNRQKYGIDYEQTFAPVAKMATVRSLLAVASMKRWNLHQMDVKNAFLHGELQENVYMKMPPGYQGQGHRVELDQTSEHSSKNMVCKLHKSLYGLKQAPRQWFSKLSTTLKDHGFVQSRSDYSMFVKGSGENLLIILVYVDDLILASPSNSEIAATKRFLSSQFHMKDMGKLRYFLGIEVDHCPNGLFLSQRKYINDLLTEYGMLNCRPLRLPMDSHHKLSINKGDPLTHAEPYQKLVGKLIYLTLTRPDIAFTVHVLSKFMHQPTTIHMQSAKRVLRYLAGSPSQGILLANKSTAKLQAYCDSDWGGCASTRRSTSGYCILLGDSPISWKSKRQSVVARSSAEAEYRSMALVICEVMWLKQLLKDLGLKCLGQTPVHCDNQAALAIAANPVHHEKTKHVDIDCHFIRDKTTEGVITPTYIPSKQQLADVFTKLLPTQQHQLLLSKLGVQNSPSLSA